MTNHQVWIYKEKRNGQICWMADVDIDGASLRGISLQIENDVCVGILSPNERELYAAVRLIQDTSQITKLCQAVSYQLRVFLHRDITLSYYGTDFLPPSDRIMFGLQYKVILHRTSDTSPFGLNYRANVYCADGIAVYGIDLVWQDSTAMMIRIPDASMLMQVYDTYQDEDSWQRVCELIRAEANGMHRSVQQMDEMSVLSSKQPISSPKSKPVSENGDSEQTDADQSQITKKEKKDTNRYGRVKNSQDNILLKYTPGSVLRPSEMIEKIVHQCRYTPKNANPEPCIKAISSGYIDALDIEILEHISQFRFITSLMLIDLYSCGFITNVQNAESFTQDRLNNRLIKLTQYGLITPCRYIKVNSNGEYDTKRISNVQIHVISKLGATLLTELGRKATARPFDVYQDGMTVRERVCVNQWIVYWLACYPEATSLNFGFDHVLYDLDTEMIGARMPGWVSIVDQLLIGQHVRRCDEQKRNEQDQELVNKAKRLRKLFLNLQDVYSFDGDEYQHVELKKRPITQYICEDETHMYEIAKLLQPDLEEDEELWLTYDQRLFNYEYEGSRFWRIVNQDDGKWIDPGIVFGIGEERKQEKRMNTEDNKRMI